MNDIERNVKNLIRSGQTDDALSLLVDFFKENNSKFHNEAIVLSGELNRLNKENRLGIGVDMERFRKINTSILEIVDNYSSMIVYDESEHLVKEMRSSEKWFLSLKNHLKVATSLQAYIKEFRAPEEAWKTNLKHILEINLQFARLIHEHLSTTRIVGYFPSNLPIEESPINWLVEEVSKYDLGNLKKSRKKVKEAINLIHFQPMPNSYTVYIIDNTRLFYNFLTPKGNYEFFDIELSSSIIPYFLNLGFEQFINEINQKNE